MPAANVSPYALTAHSSVAMLPPTLRWIAGSAVTTTSASSDTMKNEIEVSASTMGRDTARSLVESFILSLRRAPHPDRQPESGIFVPAEQLLAQRRHGTGFCCLRPGTTGPFRITGFFQQGGVRGMQRRVTVERAGC